MLCLLLLGALFGRKIGQYIIYLVARRALWKINRSRYLKTDLGNVSQGVMFMFARASS